MATRPIKFTATIIDHERESATMDIWMVLDDTTTISALDGVSANIVALLNAVTDGKVQQVVAAVASWYDFILPLAGGAYSTIEDKAFFEFRSLTTGKAGTLQLPAPKATLFTVDGETIDPADSLVAGFISAYIADYGYAGGGDLTYILGYRRRNKSRSERPGIATATG